MSSIQCDHCHLVYPQEVMIEDNGNYFCCKGCQGVYHLLNSSGLDSFYDKLGHKTLTPPQEIHSDTSRFDLETFYRQYVKKTADGFCQVDLIIEGIHCAACVWLNEKILYDTDGVLEASINFSNNKAKITWDDSKIKLSTIIGKIQSVGYNAFAYKIGEGDKIATKAKRDYFTKMMIAVFATMNIMMLGVAKYTGFFTGIEKDVVKLIHLGEFILTTPVLFYSGQIFFKGAYYGIKNKIVNMDLLVATGATFTYIYSLSVMFGFNGGESYFDSVTMIITFVLVGKYLEVLGKKSAVDTLDTIKNQIPTEATLIKNNERVIVNLQDLAVGDLVELKPGEKAVVDGVVEYGAALFDESSLTGESLPIFKKAGDKIISGTICQDSVVVYRCQKDFEHSTLNSIVVMLEDSLASKPHIEQFANQISRYFSISILLLACTTFILWYFGNFDYYGLDLQRFEKAFVVAISVIVIACPCALALATPIATLIGIGTLAKKGLIFKEARHIETMAKTTVAFVDKTGTLTEGKLSIKQFDMLEVFDVSLVYSLVASSLHPVSKSIKVYIETNYDVRSLALEDIQVVRSQGIQAKYEGRKIFGGNLEFLASNGVVLNTPITDTVFAFGIDNKVVLLCLLEDCIKSDAAHFINTLKSHNVKVVMLTGDNEAAAKKVASTLSIAYKAKLSPSQKAEAIIEAKRNNEVVICVGDGINDALMLSNSDIAVAMGSGADVSIGVSDIVVLHDSLASLEDAFVISKRTYKFIKQNLGISLVYNTLTIPLAMAGFVIPLVAALSMSLSSLLVVGNSMRIKNGR